MKVTFAIIGVIVGLLALTWIAQGNEFFLYKFFAPKREAIRREVFEQTKSYKQGMIQELENMQFEFVQADTSARSALADIILHRAADFPHDSLPVSLKQFIDSLKSARLRTF